MNELYWAMGLILFLAGLATGWQHKRDVVARLSADKDRLLEQLVAGEELYISRGIKIIQLEAKLMDIECAGCEKSLLECVC